MKWDCTNEEYHADRTCISRSTLELVKDNPKLYPIWRDGKWKRKETQEFRMGTAFHCMELELADFNKKYISTTCTDKRKKEYKDIVAANPNSIILTKPELTQLEEMSEALLETSEAIELIADGQTEQSWKFTHIQTGLECKIRTDCLRHDIYTCIELKTSKNPESFLKDVQKYGYHRQEAIYRMGLQENGIRIDTFKFVVVGTELPKPKVCIYELDFEALQIGIDQIYGMLHDFHDRKQTNNWHEKNWNETIPLSLESWYIKQHEEEISP